MRARRFTAATAAVTIVVLAALAAGALLARPLLHSLRADRVHAELGIVAAASARARAVDAAVLDSIESGSFGRELKLRLAHPPRRVRLAPFWIDRCEVSQIGFERFANWQAKQFASDSNQNQSRQSAFSTSTGHRIAGLLHSPATGVDFNGAAQYCAARGGRVPWAEELEAAAAGRDGRLYAWGDSFAAGEGAWPYLDSWRNAARACALHPQSDSPQGVHDLNANAMEWSAGSAALPSDLRMPAAHGAPAVRTRARALYALNAAWLPIPPRTRSHHLGFRCVYDAPPKQPPPWRNANNTTNADAAADAPVAIEGGEYPLGLPRDVRLTRLAPLLPPSQLRNARKLLADDSDNSDGGSRRITAGRCEVSRREYQAFLNDPLARAGLFANPQQPAGEDYLPQDWAAQLEQPDLPVAAVSWWAADAFARWAGGRLPRAREWRLLAAGSDARTYPWGNQYDPGAAVTADLLPHGPRACDADGLRDASADGARHLGGNVSEWTQSIAVDGGNYAMWVQGGNWLLPGRETASAAFGRLVPLNHRSPGIGLRVVYD